MTNACFENDDAIFFLALRHDANEQMSKYHNILHICPKVLY